ncbi:hypothetical protein EJD97_002644 [Solanum chilense]|uniref:Uncharacterized protein n=1 Tax=Solanum chilense TaxID=4083 RepID=A0A6N2BXP6_SOLCI|nr:hypothetical protein EJD97_002644 [Solanum chilense]
MWEQHVYYEWKPKYCNECLRYGHTRIKIRGMVIQGEVEKKLQVPKQVWQVVVQKGKPPIEREGRKWENLANLSKVILLTDDIDPYVVQHLLAYKGNRFHDICRDGFKFHEEDLEKSFGELVKWWTKLLDVDVKINHLLFDTPCVVVESRYGLTSFLEMLPHWEPQAQMPGRRVLEINPGHLMIKDLCDENVQRLAIAMYGIALIESGLLLTQSEISTFHPFRFAQSSLNSFGGVKKEPEIEIGKNLFEKIFPLPWSRSSRKL